MGEELLHEVGLDAAVGDAIAVDVPAVGVAIGAFQGAIIAYMQVPAFIVTLGGLLIWRGAAWWVASGKTIPLTDNNFKLMGGGADGAVGATWSWILAGIAVVAVVLTAVNARRQRMRFNFPLKPMWAEIALIALAAGAVVAATMIVNAYMLPAALARRYAASHPQVRHLRHAHRGIAATRNLGIRAARGDLIAIVADDYLLDRSYAQTVADFFGDHPEASVVRFRVVAAGADPGSRISHTYYEASMRRRLNPALAEEGKRWRDILAMAFRRMPEPAEEITTRHDLEPAAVRPRQGICMVTWGSRTLKSAPEPVHVQERRSVP